MSAHTHGTWTVRKDEGGSLSIVATAGTVERAWVVPGTPEATTGNARLTAAAPDLLAALQALVAELDGPGKPYSSDSYAPPHFIETAKAAIAKATNGASK